MRSNDLPPNEHSINVYNEILRQAPPPSDMCLQLSKMCSSSGWFRAMNLFAAGLQSLAQCKRAGMPIALRLHAPPTHDSQFA